MEIHFCRPGTRSQEGVINEEPCLPGAVFLGTAASLMCEAPEGFLQPPEQPFPRACVTLDPEQGWGDAPSGLCVSRRSAGASPPTGWAVQLCFLFSRH